MSVPVPRTKRRMVVAIFSSIRVVSMTAPNIIAERISQTVLSMLAMPPRERRLSRDSFPELRVKPWKRAIQNPLRRATVLGSSVLPT